nr:hypothetical protein [Tanacetum cinerariifolium]
MPQLTKDVPSFAQSPKLVKSPRHSGLLPPPPMLVAPSVPLRTHFPLKGLKRAKKPVLCVKVLDTCSALVLRVKGLENANAVQQLEIIKLKAMVKKLERLNKVKSSKLRRLKKTKVKAVQGAAAVAHAK